MSKEAPEWAQVGVELLEVRGGWGRAVYGDKPVKITARLKNGNVRLEGSDAQFNCSYDGHVTKAGDGRYGSRSSYRVLTDELRAEAEHERNVVRAVNRVRKEAERLENIWRHGGDDAILDAAAQLPKHTRTRLTAAPSCSRACENKGVNE